MLEVDVDVFLFAATCVRLLPQPAAALHVLALVFFPVAQFVWSVPMVIAYRSRCKATACGMTWTSLCVFLVTATAWAGLYYSLGFEIRRA